MYWAGTAIKFYFWINKRDCDAILHIHESLIKALLGRNLKLRKSCLKHLQMHKAHYGLLLCYPQP